MRVCVDDFDKVIEQPNLTYLNLTQVAHLNIYNDTEKTRGLSVIWMPEVYNQWILPEI